MWTDSDIREAARLYAQALNVNPDASLREVLLDYAGENSLSRPGGAVISRVRDEAASIWRAWQAEAGVPPRYWRYRV